MSEDRFSEGDKLVHEIRLFKKIHQLLKNKQTHKKTKTKQKNNLNATLGGTGKEA